MRSRTDALTYWVFLGNMNFLDYMAGSFAHLLSGRHLISLRMVRIAFESLALAQIVHRDINKDSSGSILDS